MLIAFSYIVDVKRVIVRTISTLEALLFGLNTLSNFLLGLNKLASLLQFDCEGLSAPDPLDVLNKPSNTSIARLSLINFGYSAGA